MIKTNREKLLQALALVRSLAKSAASLPVLSCVHLHGEDGRLVLRGTDLDSEIWIELPAEGEFSAVVSAARLQSFLAACDGKDAALQVVGGFVEIASGGARAQLMWIDPTEFPASPAEEKANTVEFSTHELIGALDLAFCASDDATRYVLNGLLFEGAGPKRKDGLFVVATDGRRLAVREFPQKISCKAVIPSSACNAMRAVLNSKLMDDAAVDLGFSEHRAILAAGCVEFSGKLIEGDFPNWRQVLPEVESGIAFQPGRLLAAVERAAAVGADSVAIEFKGDRVRVRGEAADVGNAEDAFELSLGGFAHVVKLGEKFFADGLRWCNSQDGQIAPGNGMEPLVIFPHHGGKYVLMPMRTGE